MRKYSKMVSTGHKREMQFTRQNSIGKSIATWLVSYRPGKLLGGYFYRSWPRISSDLKNDTLSG